eukprot:353532-Chlamydomonas_euryale.AAC.14
MSCGHNPGGASTCEFCVGAAEPSRCEPLVACLLLQVILFAPGEQLSAAAALGRQGLRQNAAMRQRSTDVRHRSRVLCARIVCAADSYSCASAQLAELHNVS